MAMAGSNAGRSILTLLLVIALTPAPARAQDDDPESIERRAKTALLYRFISYVEWPPAAHPKPGMPFVVGVLGRNDVAAELESYVVGRTLYNRPIVVRQIRAAESARDVHALFIGQPESAQLPAAVRAGGHTLLVTEWTGALRQGSIINFLIVEGQVRFEISLEAARQRELEISSRLLSVSQNAPRLKP
jgi:hypothetical protein